MTASRGGSPTGLLTPPSDNSTGLMLYGSVGCTCVGVAEIGGRTQLTAALISSSSDAWPTELPAEAKLAVFPADCTLAGFAAKPVMSILSQITRLPNFAYHLQQVVC